MNLPNRWSKYINVNDFDYKTNDLIEVYLIDKNTQEIRNISAMGVDKKGKLFIEVGEIL